MPPLMRSNSIQNCVLFLYAITSLLLSFGCSKDSSGTLVPSTTPVVSSASSQKSRATYGKAITGLL